MIDSRPSRLFLALCCVVFSAAFAQAAVVTVDCSKKSAKSINTTLATLDKNVANTVNIHGTCNENVVIERFKDLTLAGTGGASISDPTPIDVVDRNVLDIVTQSTVTIRSLTINGGVSGITCTDQSSCRLEDVTVQGAAGDGVSVGRSMASVRGDSRLQNNLGAGLTALVASNIDVNSLVVGGPFPTIQNNLGQGLRVWDGSFLRVVRATIQGNGGSGIDADNGSTLRMFAVMITGNGGDGVKLRASTARITSEPDAAPIITGNTGNGINVGNLSFLRLQGSRNISGNALMSPLPLRDVNCASITAATVGVLAPSGVVTTNCTEPAP